MSRPKIKIEKTIGHGDEHVYAYGFPSQRSGDSYPIKIGRAKGDPVRRIVMQQASMQELPTVYLLIQTDNSAYLEKVVHIALKSKKLSTFGNEWYLTNPSAIESIATGGSAYGGTIADQIRVARYAAGLTQDQLAKRAKVRQATVSSIESGEGGRIEYLVSLCSALGKRLELAG